MADPVKQQRLTRPVVVRARWYRFLASVGGALLLDLLFHHSVCPIHCRVCPCPQSPSRFVWRHRYSVSVVLLSSLDPRPI